MTIRLLEITQHNTLGAPIRRRRKKEEEENRDDKKRSSERGAREKRGEGGGFEGILSKLKVAKLERLKWTRERARG